MLTNPSLDQIVVHCLRAQALRGEVNPKPCSCGPSVVRVPDAESSSRDLCYICHSSSAWRYLNGLLLCLIDVAFFTRAIVIPCFPALSTISCQRCHPAPHTLA